MLALGSACVFSVIAASEATLLQWPKSIGNFTCGKTDVTVPSLQVNVDFVTECNSTIVVDNLGYRRVKSTPMLVKTRGSVHNGRFERNGNILDLVNASEFRLRPERNNAFNASGAPFPFYIQNGNLFYTGDDAANPIECKNADEGVVEQFMRVPIHASDKLTVPLCFYTYDPDVSSAENQTVLYNSSLLDARRTRDYYDNTSIKETFSADMSMRPPQVCSSQDNMCLPGRCGMLDTNYLFRLNTLEDSALRFEYTLSISNNEATLLNSVVNVLGRAQCDPMYGGGLVKDKDVNKIVPLAPLV